MAKIDPRRDAAGIGPYARERERLVPLSELSGWDVLKGNADIRSWEVKTLSGRLLGAVRELLVDPDAREVVMLDIDLAGSSRQAYAPVRNVEIDRTNRVIRADSGDLEEHVGGDVSMHESPTRYAGTAESTERVIERRPVVEETVVRRREVEEPDTRL
jgi:hypothetical protein